MGSVWRSGNLRESRLRLLSPHYAFIKKHVNLRSYSNDGLTALRNAVGHTMAYVDGGYTLIFTALPADAQRPDSRLRQKDLYNVMALALLNEAISNFQDLLRELPPRDKARITVRTQGTSDTSRFHVLERDKEFILSLLDRAVAKTNECHFLKVVCFLNQFGQKQTEGLMMGTVVRLTRIRSISLHFACNVSAQDPRISLLFSRYGLEDLVVSGDPCTPRWGFTRKPTFRATWTTSPWTSARSC